MLEKKKSEATVKAKNNGKAKIAIIAFAVVATMWYGYLQ